MAHLLGESRAASQCYVLQTDDLQAQADACAAGLGLVHLPDWTIYDHVQSGKVTLFSLQPDRSSKIVCIHLLRNPGPPTSAIEAFCKHMRQKIGSARLHSGNESANRPQPTRANLNSLTT
jgi:DNA-binding transcriptional LysR family regulator